MNIFTALIAAGAQAAGQRKRNDAAYARSRKTMQARSDARWKAVFAGEPRTTTQLTTKLGYSHMGGLSSLYKLEERKKVERIGTAPSGGNRPVILWQWIGD